MLRKDYRLREKFEFLRLKRFGKTIFTPLFNFSFIKLPTPSTGPVLPPRFGFITSNNLDKRAVVRNRVKRRVREAVRLFLRSHKLPPGSSGLSAAFIIRRAALSRSYEEIEFEVNKVLSEVFKL